MTAPHPAKWSEAILDEIGDLWFEASLPHDTLVLDPFAGVGVERLHKAIGGEVEATVVGVELEPEWLPDGGDMVQANTLRLPFRDGSFGALITSPAYGNRMADSHEAKDRCKACGGEGTIERLATPEEVDAGCELGIAFDPCRACGGGGLSKRNTYTHTLGRKPSPDSSTVMQWGDRYRTFHETAWRECARVLAPDALVVVNVKNHIRDGKEKHVAEWHLNAWLLLGARVHHVRRVATPGNRMGENGESRVPYELILVLQMPPAK